VTYITGRRRRRRPGLKWEKRVLERTVENGGRGGGGGVEDGEGVKEGGGERGGERLRGSSTGRSLLRAV
jgi:hypothetical protein